MTYVLPEIDEKIYDIQIKKGMKFALREAVKSTGSKKGDIVKVTAVTAMGMPSPGFYDDYEMVRVSNGKFSWRVSRGELCVTK